MRELNGWGRYPRHCTELISPSRLADFRSLQGRTGMIARGAGRAYGDAAIGTSATICTSSLTRMKSFDPASHILKAESGVWLSDVIATFLPRGFFPSVVPGTKFVTLGGMVAADVHGKNHHKDGGFGEQVTELKILLPQGEEVVCSRESQPELFWATVGGMGLTGTILEVSFRMRRLETGWLLQRNHAAENLGEALALLEASEAATYSVAWIDCLARGEALGRSLVFTAEHASLDDLRASSDKLPAFPQARTAAPSVPLDPPLPLLNRYSVAALNHVYFRRGRARQGKPFLNDWDSYFFPLDAVGHWNRLYGRRGFLQHQSVLPLKAARPALEKMLDLFSRRASPSFLAVLKKLGGAGGAMSFPLEGFTLALDLPVSDQVFGLLEEIDEVVVNAGGRLYLAKDARQSRQTFEAGYPGLEAFRSFRKSIGASGVLESRQSLRLEL